jgi:hypothetical protein
MNIFIGNEFVQPVDLLDNLSDVTKNITYYPVITEQDQLKDNLTDSNQAIVITGNPNRNANSMGQLCSVYMSFGVDRTTTGAKRREGINIYHKGRLIESYKKIGIQRQHNTVGGEKSHN